MSTAARLGFVPSFRTGVVTSILEERKGLQRVEVDGERAYVLTELMGQVAIGDRVVMNTTAVELGLGTGGWHVVHWNLGREQWSEAGPGHQMKLRYTSLQTDTGTAEELLADDRLAPTGVPVVVCGLHSQVGVAAVAARYGLEDCRIAYVMTDAAALPLVMSDLVHALRDGGVIDVTVTAGQSFGGDIEAVNTPSAIDLAVRDGAEIVIVGMGPGSLGTGTDLGFSGLEVGSIVDAAAVLGHVPIVAVRFSDADARARHRGVSHHTRTAVGRFAHARAVIPVPRGQAVDDLDDHDVVEVDVPEMAAVLETRGIDITTMGRGPDPEPNFFAYAAAAGVHAASLASARRT